MGVVQKHLFIQSKYNGFIYIGRRVLNIMHHFVQEKNFLLFQNRLIPNDAPPVQNRIKLIGAEMTGIRD